MTNCSDIEKMIISARRKGLAISQMDDTDLATELEDALIRVSVTCGHGLPETALFAKALISELKNFLLVYGNEDLTISEILLAFRLNCLCNLKYPSGSFVEPIEIFGKYISVDYVSKVLGNYRNLRTILDNKLKNIIDGY